jgi:DNA-binding transcriptional MerR regulator
MNLDEIREFLMLETRLDEVRATYRANKGETTTKARTVQKAMLQEAAELNESLAKRLTDKLARMEAFQGKLTSDAKKCREILAEME